MAATGKIFTYHTKLITKLTDDNYTNQRIEKLPGGFDTFTNAALKMVTTKEDSDKIILMQQNFKGQTANQYLTHSEEETIKSFTPFLIQKDEHNFVHDTICTDTSFINLYRKAKLISIQNNINKQLCAVFVKNWERVCDAR